jgi:hypothetical protein
VANTLAYYNTATITAVKSIIVQAPGRYNDDYARKSKHSKKKLESHTIVISSEFLLLEPKNILDNKMGEISFQLYFLLLGFKVL